MINLLKSTVAFALHLVVLMLFTFAVAGGLALVTYLLSLISEL